MVGRKLIISLNYLFRYKLLICLVSFALGGLIWSSVKLAYAADTISSNGLVVSDSIPKPEDPLPTAATKGDGWTPIITSTKVCTIYHHSRWESAPGGGTGAVGDGNEDISCINKSTGAILSGYPKVLKTPSGSNISTNTQSRGVLDSSTNKVYTVVYAPGESLTSGVLCYNLNTDSVCGYDGIAYWSPHDQPSGTYGTANAYELPFNASDGTIRVYGPDGRVYCRDLSGGACSSHPSSVAIGWDANFVNTLGSGVPTFVTDTVRSGSRFFSTTGQENVNYPRAYITFIEDLFPDGSPRVKLGCYNMVSHDQCFTPIPLNGVGYLPNSVSLAYYPIAIRNSTGADSGACVRMTYNPTAASFTGDICVNNTGSIVPINSIAPGMAPLLDVLGEPYESTTIGSKTLLSSANNKHVCYDSNTNSSCSGWPSTGKTFSSVNSGTTYTYGMVPDPYTEGECVWGSGDARYIWSFSIDNPSSSSAACGRTQADVALTAPLFCDTTNWKDLKIEGLDVSTSTIQRAYAYFYSDSSGNQPINVDGDNIVDLKAQPTPGVFNFNSLTTEAVPSMYVKVVIISDSVLPWNPPASPTVKLEINSDTLPISTGCKVTPMISKTNNFNGSSMGINSTFDYEITVTNAGPTTARTLSVTDTPPARVSIMAPLEYTINGSPVANGESCSVVGTQLRCTLKNVTPTSIDSNSKRIIKYKARLNAVNSNVDPAEDGLVVTNTASVSPVCSDQPGAQTPCVEGDPDLTATSDIDPEVTDIELNKYITSEFDQSGQPINWKDSNTKVVPGAKVAYRVVVTNNEYVEDHVSGVRIKDSQGNDIKTDAANNINITDKIPAGLSNLVATHSGLSGVTINPTSSASSPIDMVVHADTIDSGQSFEFVTVATYIGLAPNTSFMNFVQHTSTDCTNSDGSVTVGCNKDADSNPGNCNLQSPNQEDDCDTRGITEEKIYDLEAVKTVDKPSPKNLPGEELEYTVKIYNHGPAASPDGLTLTDSLPEEVDYISHESDSKIESCEYTDHKLECSLKSLEVGQDNAATLKIKVKLNDKAKGEAFANVAEVECREVPSSESQEQGETNCDNNTVESEVDPLLADLSLIKKIRLGNGQLVDVSETSPVGSSVTYVVELSNAGPDKAVDIEVTERIPEGLKYLSAAPEVGEYDSSSNIWKVKELAKGAKVNLVLTLVYTGGSNVRNIAEITGSGTPDPDSEPNNCSEKQEDDCGNATLTTTGKGIGIPVTGALIGKIIAGATGIALVSYLGRDLYLRNQKKQKSQR